MEIIKLSEKHIKSALSLVWEVFDEFESPDYEHEGIEEFKKFIEYNSIMEMYEKGQIKFWGSLDKDKLTGIIAMLNENHISLLFVRKEYHKKGIAKELVNTIKDLCKSQNYKSITVNSSPYAADAYHHLGFEYTDNEKILNGIRFIPMIYYIK